jgi:dTDP-4-dehydrorhamnose 3,5-epimerase
MPFRFEPQAIPEVLLIEPRVFEDERGFFMETYKKSEFEAQGVFASFVQENHSRSRRGILRGLHFQTGDTAQAKLVRVVAGEVFDVAVDLRKSSPTYGRWVGVTLSAQNRRQLCIPPWCAHGFCVTSEVAELVYKVSAEYAPALELGLRWDDPDLAIDWPVADPVLSARDREWPGFAAFASPFA